MDSDVMGVANAISAMKLSEVQTVVQTRVLKESMDIQAQAVQQLLGSAPKMNPPHLGNRIDVTY